MKSGRSVSLAGFALILIIGIAMLPSCREKSQINQRVVVTAIGIDAGADTECSLSIQAIEVLKTSGSLTEQEKNATSVYQIQGPSVASALKAFVAASGRNTYILHNKIIALGMDQVKKQPLQSMLDYFIRNHEGRPQVDMVVCRGSAKELLEVPSESTAIPADQIALMLEEGSRWGYVTRSRMLDVERSISGMYDIGLPIITVEEENANSDDGGETEAENGKKSARLDGTALFRDGNYVGDLDQNATRGLLFARGDLDHCLYVLDLPPDLGEGRITLSIQNARTQVSVTPKGNAAEFAFHVSCEAEILEEYMPENLDNSQIGTINDLLSEAIRQDIAAALEISIGEYGCDAVGLGRLTQKKHPELVRGREDQWPDILQDCAYPLTVDAKVTKIGVEIDAEAIPAL